MRWLRAILRWLAGSRLVEPVPVFHVSAHGVPGEPVPVPWSELVPRHVGRTEPFLEAELRAAVPLHFRKPQPEPRAQSEALLSWLQKLFPPGSVLRAADVELEYYPLFLEQKGWRPQPWGSRKGIGKYLSNLPGVKKLSPYLEAEDGIKERARCYQLPLDNAVTEAVHAA